MFKKKRMNAKELELLQQQEKSNAMRSLDFVEWLECAVAAEKIHVDSKGFYMPQEIVA